MIINTEIELFTAKQKVKYLSTRRKELNHILLDHAIFKISKILKNNEIQFSPGQSNTFIKKDFDFIFSRIRDTNVDFIDSCLLCSSNLVSVNFLTYSIVLVLVSYVY